MGHLGATQKAILATVGHLLLLWRRSWVIWGYVTTRGPPGSDPPREVLPQIRRAATRGTGVLLDQAGRTRQGKAGQASKTAPDEPVLFLAQALLSNLVEPSTKWTP